MSVYRRASVIFLFITFMFQSSLWAISIVFVQRDHSKKEVLPILVKLISTKILPKIPVSVQENLGDFLFKIEITKDCARDGFFYEPRTHDIKTGVICLHPDVLDTYRFFEVFVHELFHAFHFVIHPDEPGWVREGLAQWFSFRVTGEFPRGVLHKGLHSSTTSLLDSYDYETDSTNESEKYAHHFWYFYYLWSQCGGDALLWKIITGTAGIYGIEGVDRVLKTLTPQDTKEQDTKEQDTKEQDTKEQCQNFEKSALFFEVARFHNRVISDDFSNPFRFRLRSPSVQTPYNHENISSEKLQALKLYQPLLVSSNDFLDGKDLQSFIVIWLKQSYPFIVVFSPQAPAFTSDWTGLLIKIK